NITDVRRFLGMTGYYRVFIPSYAQLALPLFELLKGAAKHKVLERDAWTPERQAAFEKLKHALTQAPVLTCPRAGTQKRIFTDASEYAAGAVLEQNLDER